VLSRAIKSMDESARGSRRGGEACEALLAPSPSPSFLLPPLPLSTSLSSSSSESNWSTSGGTPLAVLCCAVNEEDQEVSPAFGRPSPTVIPPPPATAASRCAVVAVVAADVCGCFDARAPRALLLLLLPCGVMSISSLSSSDHPDTSSGAAAAPAEEGSCRIVVAGVERGAPCDDDECVCGVGKAVACDAPLRLACAEPLLRGLVLCCCWLFGVRRSPSARSKPANPPDMLHPAGKLHSDCKTRGRKMQRSFELANFEVRFSGGLWQPSPSLHTPTHRHTHTTSLPTAHKALTIISTLCSLWLRLSS
jgi:hypothetical protein